jgi:glucan phosphoethanolaminetransferase (alkaline phosphatase superfamily)
MDVLWDNSLVAFIVVTLFLGGGAAWMTGRAMARTWQPIWLLVFYCFLVSLAVRFLNFALYDGELLTLYHFLIHFAIIVVIGLLGHRYFRARQMVRQYTWINEQAGPLAWKVKQGS